MRIEDSHVVSFEVMSQAEFWPRCSEFHGDLIFAYSLDINQRPNEERILLLSGDTYYAEDDELWLAFEGLEYLNDMDVYTVRNSIEGMGLPDEMKPAALAYYIEFDSSLPSEDHPFVAEFIRQKKQLLTALK